MLTKAIKGSNAPSGSGETGVGGGSMAKDGYTIVEQPSQRPAMKNSDVADTKEFGGSLGNDGTNMSAYEDQPAKVSAENGK